MNLRKFNFRGELVFESGELEMATYEAFYENKKIKGER
jgi:hypothetical protein